MRATRILWSLQEATAPVAFWSNAIISAVFACHYSVQGSKVPNPSPRKGQSSFLISVNTIHLAFVFICSFYRRPGKGFPFLFLEKHNVKDKKMDFAWCSRAYAFLKLFPYLFLEHVLHNCQIFCSFLDSNGMHTHIWNLNSWNVLFITESGFECLSCTWICS